MGKLAVFKYVSFMFLIVTTVLLVFTIAALFGGRTNPASNHALAMLVYVLPLLIVANALLLVYWLIRRRWHWALMPTFAILCCIPYIGTFFRPNLFGSNDENRSGLIVASYNVEAFLNEISGFRSSDILAEMKRNNVDVLCMQEYREVSGDRKNSERYKEFYPFMAFGRDDMVIYSRYPIRQLGKIDFGDLTNNSAMWADVDVKGKVVRVFNVHLETTGFNRTMRKVGKMVVQGQTIKESRLVRALYDNYTMGMVVRSHQSQQVAREIENTALPVIVCGDFNDIPYSYTYHTMLGDLVDGFKECGHGFMDTYRSRMKKFRIDYIFHDKSLEGISYYKQELSYSDHYPVFMKIAL